jgi:hypothetical protein
MRLVFLGIPEKREKQRIARRMVTVTTEQARCALLQYSQLSVREDSLPASSCGRSNGVTVLFTQMP